MSERPRAYFLRFKTRMYQRIQTVNHCMKKTPQIAGGFCLTWICFANPANALNGNTYVTSCACKTTADFASAAKNQATLRYTNTNSGKGLYTISSTTSASTAYMSVTGQFVTINGDPTWVATAALPIDANGNSLAGLSEGAQEAVYAAIDSIIIGGDRNNFLLWTSLNLTPFASTNDPAISAQYFQQVPGITEKTLPSGTLVTLTWNDGSGIVATFEVQWLNGKLYLSFQHGTKNGQPINRDGSPKTNPNKSGTGGGSVIVPVVGNEGGGEWTIGGHDACYVSAYYTAPDGEMVGSGSWAPC